MDLKQAVNYIVRRRAEELAHSRAVLNELIKNNPQFRAVELNARSVELDYALGKATQAELDAVQAERASLIKTLGLENVLYPPYHCNKCKDTGLVGSKYCECAKAMSINSNNELIRLPLRSFNELTPDLYGEYAPFIVKVATEVRTICLKGRSAVRKNINLLGKTGTGKTFLASCFAGECVRRGRSVVFITAFDFFERARKYHTTFTSDKDEFLAPLIECDTLIVDDLGSESILKNITVEYLYSIVNERQLAGKLTFITSNLSLDEFAIRYGERTASRLFDKKLCYTREFNFPDIRKISINN